MELLTRNSKLKKTSKEFGKRVFNFGIPAFSDPETGKRKRVDYLRVHDSGDYYSRAYIAKWIEIARRNPNVKFYSYTKSIPLFKEIDLPDNYDIIYSEGSTVDDLIDTTIDRHSRIFDTVGALSAAGYADASNYDLYATKWFNKNHKVGLVIH